MNESQNLHDGSRHGNRPEDRLNSFRKRTFSQVISVKQEKAKASKTREKKAHSSFFCFYPEASPSILSLGEKEQSSEGGKLFGK